MRELLTTFINTLMSAEADAVCGAAYGQVSPDRINRRNGYRHRDFDTRVGTLDLAVPKLRTGHVLPGLAAGAAQAGRAGADHGGGDLLPARGLHAPDGQAGPDPGHHDAVEVAGLGDGQGARRARGGVPHPPAGATPGPFTFVAADAFVLKVREGGRVVAVHVLVATGVNGDGHREILGVQVTTSEDGAGWLGFFRDLVARGLSGVKLVTSDAHAGLVAAIAATLPGASWQRCRTHYAANLMSATPKSSWGWVKALLHCVYDQPDAEAVHAQFDRVVDALNEKLPSVAEHLEHARADILAFTAFPKESGARSGPTTPTSASTARSAAAPTSSASSPTAPPSSGSSAPSWPSNTTNGPKAAATSDSTSSPDSQAVDTPHREEVTDELTLRPSRPEPQRRRITRRTPPQRT